MSEAQKKPSFNQVKSKAEELKVLAYELAYDQLPHVLKSKKGAVQKESISFQPLEMRALKELRKWEATGLRKAAWDWDTVLRSYKNHPKKNLCDIFHCY